MGSDKAADRSASRVDRRMLLLVGSLTTLGPLCVDMYLTSLPTISRDLTAGASAVQLSVTTCLLGLAGGQVIFGPLSDRFGRKPPLIFGLVAFVVVSALCVVAPNIATLVSLRFLQGFAGAAGAVTARAIVRDLYSGVAAARFFSFLVLVTGVSPLLAPQLGALLLHLGSWRVEFVAVAVLGVLVLGVAVVLLPETLPVRLRRADGFVAMLATARMVATDRMFAINGLVMALGFGSIWAYVAGSSFVLENAYGVSPTAYSAIFAINGLGFVVAAQINGRLVARYGPSRLLTVGIGLLAGAGIAVLVIVLVGGTSVPLIVAAFGFACCSNGFIAPNAMALAMNDFPHAAGSAAALLGVCQYALGATMAPLAGVGGDNDPLPTALLMCCFGIAAIVVQLCFGRRLHGAVPIDRASAGIDPLLAGSPTNPQ